MTSMLEKSMGSVAYHNTEAVEPATHHNTGQNLLDNSPQAALEEVLRFNNELPNHPKITVDPRIHELTQLQKIIKTSDMLDEVIGQLSDDGEKIAKDLRNRLSRRFDAMTMSEGQSTNPDQYGDTHDHENTSELLSNAHFLHAALLDGEGQSTNPDQYGDIYNYENTVATSGILLAEQLQKFSNIVREGQSLGQIRKDDVKDAIRRLDIDVIVQITEQRANYAKAHRHESLHNKVQAFTKLLDSLNDSMAKINNTGDLPIAKAINHLTSAKALHDLALLGEFGSKENRDIALRAAVNDLWDAKSEIESSAYASEATIGILGDIEDYIGKYSRELGIDPANKPEGKVFEITGSQKSKVIRNLGAAAYSETATGVRSKLQRAA